MYSYKCFNSNYMEIVGYETHEKLMWTSGKYGRNKNTIRKQVFPKRNMNMTSPSGTLGFGCSPHNVTYNILSETSFS